MSLLLQVGILRQRDRSLRTHRGTPRRLNIYLALAACVALALGAGAKGQAQRRADGADAPRRGRQLVVQSGHTGWEVTCVAHSPDGKLLATGGSELKVWEASTSRLLYTMSPGGQRIVTLAFASDSVTLAAGHYGGGVSVWDATTGQNKRSWKAFARRATSLVFHPHRGNLLIASGRDGDGLSETGVKFWDAANEKLLRQFTVEESSFDGSNSLAISPDGNLLAGSVDDTIFLWDGATGKERWKQEIEKSKHISNVVFTPDGKQLVAAVEYRSDEELKELEEFAVDEPARQAEATKQPEPAFKVWDAESGKEVKSIQGGAGRGHSERVTAIAISRDGEVLASGGADRNIILWKLSTGREIGPLLGHADRVSGLSFSHDGRRLVSVGEDGTVRVWELTADASTVLRNRQAPAFSAVFSPDGRELVSGHEGAVKVWDLAGGNEVRTLPGDYRPIQRVEFSRDGNLLVALDEGFVSVWEHLTWELKLRVRADSVDGTFRACALSPDAKTLAVGGGPKDEGVITFWDVATGAELGILSKGPSAPVRSLAFSPDGKLLASGGDNGELILWNLDWAGATIQITSFPAGGAAERAGFRSGDVITGVDGHKFVTGWALLRYLRRPGSGPSKIAHVRRGAQEIDISYTRKEDSPLELSYSSGATLPRHPLPGHSGNVISVAFSPDGTLLASADASRDKPVVRLWDIKSKSEQRTLAGGGRAGFSPDGRWLARRVGDELKLWDVAAGREAGSIPHAQPAFSPDGRFVVGFDDDTVTFSEAATGRQVGWVAALGELDWVAADAHSRFTGSRGGLALLHYRKGTRTTPLSDGFEQAYRPRLLAALLAASPRQKERARSPSPGTAGGFAPPNGQPPRLKLAEGENVGTAPAKPTGTTTEQKLVISFEVKDSGGGIGNVELYRNGYEDRARSVLKSFIGTAPAYDSATSASVRARYEISLEPGANEIKLLAHDADGTQRSTQVFERILEIKKEEQAAGQKSESQQYIENLVNEARQLRDSFRGFARGNKISALGTLVEHGKELVRREQNYGAARKWFEYALRVGEHELGESDTTLVESLRGLAALELARGHFKAAEAYLKRALAIVGRSQAKEIEDLVLLYDLSTALAQLYTVRGDLYAAERAYQLLLETFFKLEPVITLQLFPQLTQVLLDYIQVLKAQGDEETAGEITLLLYNLLEKFTSKIANDANLPKEQAEGLKLTMQSMPQMALIMYRGNKEKFGEALESQIKAMEALHGEESFEVIQGLVNLANFYLTEGKYTGAERLLLRAKNIKGRILPEGFLFDWMIDRSFAHLALVKGDFATAREIATRSLKSFQQLELTRFHPDLITLHYLLALSYQFEGKYAEAERELLRAATTSLMVSGDKGPLRIEVANTRAVLAQLRGDYKEALARQTETNKLTEQNLAGALAIRSEGLKQNFLSGLEQQTDAALSLQVNAGMNNVEARRLALTAVLQRKGRILDAMTGASQTLRRSLSPADQKLFDDLSNRRTKLATLVVRSVGQMASEEVQTEIRTLEVEVGKLEGELSSRSKEFYAQARTVTPELVQAALPKGAALVEFAKYRPLNRRAKSLLEMYGPPRYMAFVLPQTGQPQSVEIGEADEIDSLAKAFRAALRNPTNVQRVKEAGRNLDERVMSPARRLLDGRSEHLLISPDGSLNLVPFAAMVDEQGKYLVQSHLITYLTSGRDLLRPAAADGIAGDPVVVADPDFGVADAAPPNPEPPSPSRRRSGGFKESFFRLGDTAREAETVLKLYPNAQPLTGGQATEASVKKVRRPLLLHIATHGFFNDAVRPASEAGAGASLLPPSPASALGSENPLLRSGLALAGANQLKSGDNEDGYLTALEISALDLTGTKLVVLSACETGLGAVASGEGIYGLRRALILAGSESQVISLWRVNIEATNELIIDYYNNLQAGAGRSEALRKAQFKMLGLPDGTPGAAPRESEFAHPYFWSGFVQNGRWEGLKAGGR
jgi:WD40 repeat protein/CHAT domain-containing protein